LFQIQRWRWTDRQHVTCHAFKDAADLNRRVLQQTIARSPGGLPARRRLGDCYDATSAVWRAHSEWVLIARG